MSSCVVSPRVGATKFTYEHYNNFKLSLRWEKGISAHHETIIVQTMDHHHDTAVARNPTLAKSKDRDNHRLATILNI